MLMSNTLPPDVYIDPHKTRPLAGRMRTLTIRPLGAIAVPGMPGQPGVVFKGVGDGPSSGFYLGLALGALGMYGIMRFLG